MRIIVISGMSGSGKSTAVKALEDEGFYCIDNLPVHLFRRFIELIEKSGTPFKGIALVVDIRGRELITGFANVFRRLRKSGRDVEIFFFDAQDATLIRRFSETRRRHPAGDHCTLPEAIAIERERLADLRRLATQVIDTSEFNVKQLKEHIQRFIRGDKDALPLVVEVQSFGFRYGVPLESSIVMDVRFIPNPFFVPRLKMKSGLDSAVSAFVMKQRETQQFLEHFFPLLDLLVPFYQNEGKSYLTISIGCTGGRHRSVALAEAAAAHLKPLLPAVKAVHRDIEKELS